MRAKDGAKERERERERDRRWGNEERLQKHRLIECRFRLVDIATGKERNR